MTKKRSKKDKSTRGTDEAFLQLMTVTGNSILKLLGVPSEKAEQYHFRAVMLKEKRLEPDVEGIPMLVSENEPIFIEFQGYSDPYIRYRLAAEVFEGCTRQKYKNEVIAGIIYTDSEYKTAALPLKALKAKGQTIDSFKEIVLTDYTEKKLCATDPKLVVLAPFTLPAKTKKAILLNKSREWRDQVAQTFPSHQQQEDRQQIYPTTNYPLYLCGFKNIASLTDISVMLFPSCLSAKQCF